MNAHYRQLTQSQRYQIEAGLASGMALSGIAKQIGVHTSTVSREVIRNSSGGRYKAEQAGGQCDDRRSNARKYCKPRAWLTSLLPTWLEMKFSPEQIANRLRLEGSDHVVSHEWIYRFIDTDICDSAAGSTENAMEATTGGGSFEIGYQSVSDLQRLQPVNESATGKATLCMARAVIW